MAMVAAAIARCTLPLTKALLDVETREKICWRSGITWERREEKKVVDADEDDDDDKKKATAKTALSLSSERCSRSPSAAASRIRASMEAKS